ncbi:hypothetical protein BGW42_001274 [Actinomortierella wolfii]|nr:hypothetical protein BGW42_001274 [Actinomortierella wolfii]
MRRTSRVKTDNAINSTERAPAVDYSIPETPSELPRTGSEARKTSAESLKTTHKTPEITQGSCGKSPQPEELYEESELKNDSQPAQDREENAVYNSGDDKNDREDHETYTVRPTVADENSIVESNGFIVRSTVNDEIRRSFDVPQADGHDPAIV